MAIQTRSDKADAHHKNRGMRRTSSTTSNVAGGDLADEDQQAVEETSGGQWGGSPAEQPKMIPRRVYLVSL
ncbi:hypothetical protein CU103_21125 [Phyllobacterium sophorae]|uniref:Uncharacterized protein n=1 Tax=Phyllobacterium sophorae TaxID=1520277 RepID=A0A2P7B5T7_9HYPH|nr:hypothetical protein CU103_21125 [Phyllobacterium sophorae]